MTQTLLVTGASGNLGRRVVELLVEKQAGRIIAATRTPDKLADIPNVETRRADFDDVASLDAAFAEVDRLLIISTDKTSTSGERRQQHVNAVHAAERAGVKHVVYTSLLNATDTPVLIAPDHAGTEAALADSALGWTVLRENIYTEVLLGGLMQAAQMGGQIYSAVGDGRIAHITREDCAQAAAAALASDFDGRRTLDITGPQALSQAEIAALATRITGTPFTYVPIPKEALVDGMVKAGLPAPVAEIYASFDVAASQGKFDVVSGAVAELSGRGPISVKDFLTANREALAQAVV